MKNTIILATSLKKEQGTEDFFVLALRFITLQRTVETAISEPANCICGFLSLGFITCQDSKVKLHRHNS